MAVTPDNQSLQTTSDAQDSASLDLPISMVERFMAQMRRVRWMIVAIGVVVCVLLVSGRIDVAEAAFTFGFLALTAIVTGTVAAQRSPLARATKQPKTPKRPSYEQLIRAWPQPVILVDQRLIIRTINEPASELMEIRKPAIRFRFACASRTCWPPFRPRSTRVAASTQTILEKVPSERMLQLHIRPFSYTGTSGLPDPGDRREGKTARFVAHRDRRRHRHLSLRTHALRFRRQCQP
jgi:hypothetical protein